MSKHWHVCPGCGAQFHDGLWTPAAPADREGTASDALAFIRACMAEDQMVRWPGEIDDILEGLEAIYGPSVPPAPKTSAP